jgi:hypothetical protein
MSVVQFIRRGSFNLQKTNVRLQKNSIIIPKLLANMAVNHYKRGFQIGGGMTNKSRGGWKRRKNNIDPGRGILIGKGTAHLKFDIRQLQITRWKAIVGTTALTKDYAIVHNKGIGTMPQREFIGDSAELNVKALRIINIQLAKAFKF